MNGRGGGGGGETKNVPYILVIIVHKLYKVTVVRQWVSMADNGVCANSVKMEGNSYLLLI